MRGKLFIKIIFSAILFMVCLTGCYDKMFPPVICNGYSHDILLKCVFRSGETASVKLPSGASMVQREEGLIFEVLAVTTLEGKHLGEYTADDFRKKEKGERVMSELISIAGICALLGLALMIVAWRMIKNADLSDMGNPNKPKIRF